MAFVSRAARQLQAYEDTAAGAIGPGAYIRPDYKHAEQGYAPFSSTTERSTQLATGPSFNPAPGDYEKPVNWAASRVGEAAFKSRVERLRGAENPSIAPGPGSYPLENGWIKKTAHASPERQDRRTVLFNRQPTAPSVPARHQSYGYEETERGQLVAQKPTHPPPKNWPGPGEYDPEPVKPEKKAVDFSRVPARTENFGAAGRDGPGPGAYETQLASAGFAGSNIRKRVVAPFGSRVPLDCHKPVYEDELDGPGPGSYDVAGVRSGQRRSLPTGQHGFSVSKRGAEQDAAGRAELPGPGAYDPYEAAPAARRHQGLDKKAAFNSNTNRFKRVEDQPTANVGPGAYVDSKGFADEVLKQRPRRSSGAFGSAGPRFAGAGPKKAAAQAPGAEEGAASGPGPGAYDLEPKAGAGLQRLSRKESAAFASTTARLEGNPNLALEPGPGLYDTRPKWDRDEQRGYRAAKSVFVTKEKRFAGTLPKHLVLGPGPGQYESEQRLYGMGTVPRGAVLSTTAPRFGDQGMRQGYVPGPGQYNMNRELVKPSFNVTLDCW